MCSLEPLIVLLVCIVDCFFCMCSNVGCVHVHSNETGLESVRSNLGVLVCACVCVCVRAPKCPFIGHGVSEVWKPLLHVLAALETPSVLKVPLCLYDGSTTVLMGTSLLMGASVLWLPHLFVQLFSHTCRMKTCPSFGYAYISLSLARMW